MTTLFISDLHLDGARPAATEAFERLLQNEARGSEAVYILGDLFEYWLGDDVETPVGARVRAALGGLVDAGVEARFLHGNRDFLVGSQFADVCGFELLDEEVVIDLYGTPTLLLHGDSLCTDDHAYQAVRTELRSAAWQRNFLAQAPEWRIDFARDARARSRAHQMNASMDIMDVNSEAVDEAFRRHGVRHMIHGHTHRPAIHDLRVDGKSARRTVLGDWYEQASVLRVRPDSFELGGL